LSVDVVLCAALCSAPTERPSDGTEWAPPPHPARMTILSAANTPVVRDIMKGTTFSKKA
jgi:hypothetical protein